MLEEHREIYLETDFEFCAAYLSTEFETSIIYQIYEPNNPDEFYYYVYSPELASVDFSLDHLVYADKQGWLRSSQKDLGSLYKCEDFTDALNLLRYCNNYEQFYSEDFEGIIQYFDVADPPKVVIEACLSFLFIMAEPFE